MSSGSQEQNLLSVWGMKVVIDSQLSSISVLSTDLNRIQTPHRLFWVLEQIIPLQPVGQAAAAFKFESKFQLLLVICSGNLSTV